MFGHRRRLPEVDAARIGTFGVSHGVFPIIVTVVAGVRETKRQILLYTLLLTPLAVVPAVIGMASWVYGAVAGTLGLGFVALAVGIWRDPGERFARRTFGYSILYLFLIFAALMADRALGL